MRERMEEEIFRRSLYKVRQKRQFGKERGESKEAERKKEEKKCESERGTLEWQYSRPLMSCLK